MDASRQVESPFYRRTSRQCGQGFGRTAKFLLPELIVPATKCIGAVLLEYAVPDITVPAKERKKIQDGCTECEETNSEKTIW